MVVPKLQCKLLCLVIGLIIIPISAFPQDELEYWALPVKMIKAGQYEQAIREIDSRLEDLPGDTLLLRLKGVCLLELSRPEEAAEVLSRAVKSNPENEASRFYYAKALAYAGRVEGAIRNLEILLRQSPESPYAVQAKQAIETLSDLLQSASPQPEGKRWDFYGRMAQEYDDNVPARSSEDDGPRASFRSVFSGYFEIRPLDQNLDQKPATLGTGISAYVSRHLREEFTDYDLNAISAQVFLRRVDILGSWPCQLSLRAGHSHTEIGYAPFSNSWDGEASLELQWADNAALTPGYSISSSDYDDDTDLPDIFSRDGVQQRFGVEQYFYLLENRLILGLGYGYRISNTEGSQFDAASHEASLSLTAKMPFKLVFSSSFSFAKEGYADFDPEPKRLDGIYTLYTALSRPLWGDSISVELSYTHSRANSNWDFAEYRRNVYGLALVATF